MKEATSQFMGILNKVASLRKLGEKGKLQLNCSGTRMALQQRGRNPVSRLPISQLFRLMFFSLVASLKKCARPSLIPSVWQPKGLYAAQLMLLLIASWFYARPSTSPAATVSTSHWLMLTVWLQSAPKSTSRVRSEPWGVRHFMVQI